MGWIDGLLMDAFSFCFAVIQVLSVSGRLQRSVRVPSKLTDLPDNALEKLVVRRHKRREARQKLEYHCEHDVMKYECSRKKKKCTMAMLILRDQRG